MGKLKNGIFGGFTGKVGNLVGSSWRGTPYVRSLPSKKPTIFSEAQLAQQSRFALMSKFLSGFKNLFATTFKNSGNITGANASLSFNLINGIKGDYPNYEVNYPKIQISRGNLFDSQNATAKAGKDGKVDYSWNYSEATDPAKGTDIVILVMYNPLTGQVSFTLQGALRERGSVSFFVSSNRGCAVETWIAFMSANTKYLSNSMYTGNVSIS